MEYDTKFFKKFVKLVLYIEYFESKYDVLDTAGVLILMRGWKSLET